MTEQNRRIALSWSRIAITGAAAAATYFVRPVLAIVGLQALTFILPVLFAAYFFGWILAAVASVFSLGMAHILVWQQGPQLLFTRQYFGGILNFAFISSLIILYTYRQELVLRRLDRSLEGETIARAEAEEANRLKDQFLATLSHELRTPTNVMLGYLEMLLTDRANSPRRALEIVYRNAQQQARLIEDVLDASRIAAGTFTIHPEPVTPVAIMREVVESVQPAAAAKNLNIVVTASNPNVAILADPHRLRQVFWNVLSNAVKFTPADGRIEVQIEGDGSHLEITVQDTGRGIAPEFLPYVFDMFRQGDASTTRDVSGMGLGLTLVKRFVELQGGEVAVHSPGEGHGTTFTCRFPIETAVQRPNPLPQPENATV